MAALRGDRGWSASRSQRRAPRYGGRPGDARRRAQRSSARPIAVAPRLDRDRPRRHAAPVRPHRLRAFACRARRGPRRRRRGRHRDRPLPRGTREIAADAGIGGVAICANGATLYDLDTDPDLAHRPLAAPTAPMLVRGFAGSSRRSPSAGSTSSASAASLPTRRCARRVVAATADAYQPCDPLDWTLPMTKLIARLPAPTSSTSSPSRPSSPARCIGDARRRASSWSSPRPVSGRRGARRLAAERGIAAAGSSRSATT